MAKFYLTLLVIAAISSIAFIAKVTDDTKLYIVPEIANLRSGPSTKHDVIYKVTKYDQVIKIDKIDNWTEVYTNDGIQGWIRDDLLTNKAPYWGNSPVFEMKQQVDVGYTRYIVWSAVWQEKIGMSTYADASFLMIKITIRNLSNKPRSIPPFKLFDEYGSEYESTYAAGLVKSDISILDSLNPGVAKNGEIVFDVPRYRRYKLLVDGGFWSDEKAYIDIRPKE